MQQDNLVTSQNSRKRLKNSVIALFSSALSLFSLTAVAGGPDQIPSPELTELRSPAKNHWEVFGGLGYSNYFNGTNNHTFLVTPAQPPASAEIDQLSQSNHGSSVGYTAGFDKVYALTDKTNHKLQGISAGLTLRYDPATFKGQVWQYQDPAQNNYRYRYQVRPISFFAESDLMLAKIHCVSAFTMIGLGMTEAKLNYQEAASNGAQPISAQNGSRWITRPDVAAGAGLLWDFKNSRYFLKTQYLYQYRGMARLGGIAAFSQGVPVNLNEQSVDVLFGMRLS